MPMLKVTAKPFTVLVVKPIKIMQVIKVEMLPSKIDGQALLNASFIAIERGLSFPNSSFKRSKTKILASTAMPKERIKPAIPESVKVTGIVLNTAKTIRA